MKLIEKVFGTHSERELKLIYPIVDKIVAMRPEMMALSDEDLKDNTRKFYYQADISFKYQWKSKME